MAMLQRKDLAKEFSLIVQQEIKNHQDSLLSVNMALEEIRSKLNLISEQKDKKISELESKIVMFTSAISADHEMLSADMKKCAREMNDSKSSHTQNLKSIQSSMDVRESYFLTLEGFEVFKKNISEWMSRIQFAFAQQKDTLTQEISKVYESTRTSLEFVRKAVQKSLDEEVKERKEQDTSLDIFAVNFEGMKRELEILKKRCFILEKNNENIYTQIERVKEGVK